MFDIICFLAMDLKRRDGRALMKCKLSEGGQLILRTWPHHKLVCFVGFRKVGNLCLRIMIAAEYQQWLWIKTTFLLLKKALERSTVNLPRGWVWPRVNTLNEAQREAQKCWNNLCTLDLSIWSWYKASYRLLGSFLTTSLLRKKTCPQIGGG